MQGAAELASDVFGTGVRVGVPSERLGGLSDSVEAPRYSTAAGLAQYGASRIALGATSSMRRTRMGSGVGGAVDRIKFWLQDFF
jgi:cell division ATPase FtsA